MLRVGALGVEAQWSDMRDALGLNFRGKIPAIDGLRAIAIISVMGFHDVWPGFSWGGRGVDLFFVISGFLIASMLAAETERLGTFSLSKFYKRRVLRIFPAYFVFLAGYSLVCVVLLPDLRPSLISSLLIAGSFSTDVSMGWFNHPVLVAHTWTLAIEEQFHLLFPILLVTTTRRQSIIAVTIIIIVTLAWRVLLCSVFDVNESVYRITFAPDTRIDTI